MATGDQLAALATCSGLLRQTMLAEWDAAAKKAAPQIGNRMNFRNSPICFALRPFARTYPRTLCPAMRKDPCFAPTTKREEFAGRCDCQRSISSVEFWS